MNLLIKHNPVPSTINLKYGDEPITFNSTNDNGPVSSTWTLTYDRGFQYSERIGSLGTSAGVFTATGTSVTYYLPKNAPQSWQGQQHAVLIVTPADGSPARSLIITIN
jgi:hypothetical protein